MAMNGRSFEDIFRSRLFYELDRFCDAAIVTKDGGEFKVHKLVLSKASGYFQAFYRFNAGKEGEVLELNFDKAILENILLFLYTREIYLDEKNITDIILAADYLLVDPLLIYCKHFVIQKISLSCCVPLLVTLHAVERLGITEYCYRFVQVNFGRLVHKHDSGIAVLPLNILINLLRDDSLGVINEDTVLEAIVIWVKGSPKLRLKNVRELLFCIRWSTVNYWLVSYIAAHPIFQESPFCESRNLELLIQSPTSQVQEDEKWNIYPFRCPQKMYVFISAKSFPHSNSVLEIYLTYDGQLDIWRKIGETDSNFHTLIAANGFVFFFNTMSNQMKAFDLVKKEWFEKNNIRTTRQGYCVVQGQNRIFAVGGFVFMSNTQLSDVECYNPVLDSWSYCAPIPPINICGASIITKMLYVIGYVEEHDGLEMRALVYDMARDVWSDIKTPNQFRTNFGIINFHERLFIFGGKTEENTVTTAVEAYCPKRNKWEEFPFLPFPYELPHAVILKDKLMVYDDCPGGVSVPRLPPCTWRETDKMWEVENGLSPLYEIHRYEFCSIDDRNVLSELATENKDPETVWTKTPFVIY